MRRPAETQGSKSSAEGGREAPGPDEEAREATDEARIGSASRGPLLSWASALCASSQGALEGSPNFRPFGARRGEPSRVPCGNAHKTPAADPRSGEWRRHPLHERAFGAVPGSVVGPASYTQSPFGIDLRQEPS
jgi:hypothetical protein